MKALLISDDENLVKECSSILEAKNYDVIIYKWLLKALDNIEEIRPNLIVVSSSEYPRHWKTLVQFVKSGIGGDNVDIYLFEPSPLSKDDLDKAHVLGINGYFTQTSELEGLLSGEADEIPSVDSITSSPLVEPVETNTETSINSQSSPLVEPVETNLETNNEVQSSMVSTSSTDDADISVSVTGTGHILITHPDNNCFLTGKVTEYSNNNICATLDFNTNLKPGTEIDNASYIWNGEIKSFNCIVEKIEGKKITLEIKKYYEE